jgi:hypothetical protein
MLKNMPGLVALVSHIGKNITERLVQNFKLLLRKRIRAEIELKGGKAFALE